MKYLHVSVGIIRNARKEIFLAQRVASNHMRNMWEFPGGKIESNESAVAALKRELQEETDIEVVVAQPFDTATYPSKEVNIRLNFFIVEAWNGTPWGREGQPTRWVPQSQLMTEEFPPANAAIIHRLIAEVSG